MCFCQSLQLGNSILFVVQNRSMEEDLRSMMCADGLALARSTLVSLTGFHSKAKRIYGPIECNTQLNHLAVHRPEVQVRTYALFRLCLVVSRLHHQCILSSRVVRGTYTLKEAGGGGRGRCRRFSLVVDDGLIGSRRAAVNRDRSVFFVRKEGVRRS